MKLTLIFAAIIVLTAAGPISAEPCVDACREAHCNAKATCESNYVTCLADAHGEPATEALCLQ